MKELKRNFDSTNCGCEDCKRSEKTFAKWKARMFAAKANCTICKKFVPISELEQVSLLNEGDIMICVKCSVSSF